MISLIICSKQGQLSSELEANIAATIGVDYELIVIDNSSRAYSIFSAYNEGIKRASFDYLCFMHEDILYCSDNWGRKVAGYLSVPETGLIGLAGSYYLPDIPTTWYKAKPYVKNQIQTRKGKPPKQYTLSENKEVVCVDGFWFCSRKDVFERVAFDEKTFNDFHFYDLDISMQIRQAGYSIFVVCDIIVNHFSGGSRNKQWLESAYLFYEKWKNSLPVTVNPSLKKKALTNEKTFRDLLYVHKKCGVPVSKETWRIGWHALKFRILTACLLFVVKLPF